MQIRYDNSATTTGRQGILSLQYVVFLYISENYSQQNPLAKIYACLNCPKLGHLTVFCNFSALPAQGFLSSPFLEKGTLVNKPCTTASNRVLILVCNTSVRPGQSFSNASWELERHAQDQRQRCRADSEDFSRAR